MSRLRLLWLATALAAAATATPALPTTARANGTDKVPLEVSQGDSLTAAEESAVKGVLLDYLSALKARNFRRAGAHIDEPTFRALADSMVIEAAGDSLPLDEVRRTIFGMASRDSMRARPVPLLFETLVAASEAADPGAFGAVAGAQIDVLAVRRVDHHVVIAYQLTIPGAGPEGQPLTHVTAETMRPTKWGWKIVFRR
jgi:hypothetical protein